MHKKSKIIFRYEIIADEYFIGGVAEILRLKRISFYNWLWVWTSGMS